MDTTSSDTTNQVQVSAIQVSVEDDRTLFDLAEDAVEEVCAVVAAMERDFNEILRLDVGFICLGEVTEEGTPIS